MDGLTVHRTPRRRPDETVATARDVPLTAAAALQSLQASWSSGRTAPWSQRRLSHTWCYLGIWGQTPTSRRLLVAIPSDGGGCFVLAAFRLSLLITTAPRNMARPPHDTRLRAQPARFSSPRTDPSTVVPQRLWRILHLTLCPRDWRDSEPHGESMRLGVFPLSAPLPPAPASMQLCLGI